MFFYLIYFALSKEDLSKLAYLNLRFASAWASRGSDYDMYNWALTLVAGIIGLIVRAPFDRTIVAGDKKRLGKGY